MVAQDILDATPAERAHAAADALGDARLVGWCGDLICGRTIFGDASDPDPGWLAGRAVASWGAPARLVGETGYWARVWAARTLLYVWDDSVVSDLVVGLGDPAWRVREMCAKVSVRWDVVEAADPCAALVGDETPRVRVAALRVLGLTGEAEHADAVRAALTDPEPAVRDAAERALRHLARRLDRPLAR